MSDGRLRAALDESWGELDTLRVWTDEKLAQNAQGYLAAHKLSITFADPQDPALGNYLKEFQRLQKRATSGFRVA